MPEPDSSFPIHSALYNLEIPAILNLGIITDKDDLLRGVVQSNLLVAYKSTFPRKSPTQLFVED